MKLLYIKKFKIFLSIILLLGALSSLKGKSDSPPNIVLILVDDMGWTDLGCYGSSFYETPNIDRLASGGMRFTDGYAASSVCSPTRASLMTGKHPVSTGVTDWIKGRLEMEPRYKRFMKLLPAPFDYNLALKEETLAEALKARGYRTGIFGKWHLGEEESHWPENQGFDVNVGGWKRGAPYYPNYDWRTDTWGEDSGFVSPYKNPRLEDGPDGEYLPDRLTDETIEFMKANDESPFFAYLSFYAVHNPMHAKPEKREKYERKREKLGLNQVDPFVRYLPWMVRHDQPYPNQFKSRVIQSNPVYGGMVESVDENVGRVLDQLETMGLDENTLVIFTSDNGGLSTAEGSPTSNRPLRTGKGWLYEGGIRVPTIFRWTGTIPEKTISDTIMTSADVFPTVMDALGELGTHEGQLDGKSLLPVLKGQEHSLDRESVFWHYPHHSNQGDKPASAIRKGRYKLIEYYESGRVELFDLENDIGETQNLVKELPKRVNELKNELDAWRKSMGAIPPGPENSNYDPGP